MKKQVKKIVKKKVGGTTTVTPYSEGLVRIRHHQSIRASKNYNSAEIGYDVTIDAKSTKEAVETAILRLELTVEEAIEAKYSDMLETLNNLPA